MPSPMVFISHESALEFWRHHDFEGSDAIRKSRLTSIKGATASIRAIKPLVRKALPTSGKAYGARTNDSLLSCLTELNIEALPLHVMVNQRENRRSSPHLISHLYEKRLPEGSFCRIDDHVYVASPELTLCQLATSLSYAETLELCLEFCGGYTLNPQRERGFDDRPPLTNAKRLQRYVSRLGGRRGAKQLRPLLRYVVDDSASPMESITLMLLCLHTRLGGYQLPMPKHNVDIPITERARSHTSRKKLVADLYWEEYRLDVECNSTLHHSSKEQLGVDADRKVILEAMDYSYVMITAWQLEHADEFLNVVQGIRRIMGFKLRRTPAHVAANREALRRFLTTPHGQRGPLRLVTASKA